MKNHALNPSVVTYEHDTRRLRHALPPPLSQLWTPHSNHGVCDPSTSPSPPLPPYFNARVYLLEKDLTWAAAAARSLFFVLSFCPFWLCAL